MENITKFIITLLFTIVYANLGYGINSRNEPCPITNKPNELFQYFTKVIPPLKSNTEEDTGTIGVIGGNLLEPGAPYFTAISSLRTGANMVRVITTPEAASIIKAYSPEIMVYSYLYKHPFENVLEVLSEIDVLVIGPGLEQHDKSVELLIKIIEFCKQRKMPLIIDDDAIYLVAKNLSLLQYYPEPGIIITANRKEFDFLQKSLQEMGARSISDIGINISILNKGKYDRFLSGIENFQWRLLNGGSVRRSLGQGNVLAGALATFFHWSLKNNICNDIRKYHRAAAVSSIVAAKVTRLSNYLAFEKFNHSMTTSDMIDNLRIAYGTTFSILTF